MKPNSGSLQLLMCKRKDEFCIRYVHFSLNHLDGWQFGSDSDYLSTSLCTLKLLVLRRDEVRATGIFFLPFSDMHSSL